MLSSRQRNSSTLYLVKYDFSTAFKSKIAFYKRIMILIYSNSKKNYKVERAAPPDLSFTPLYDAKHSTALS